MATKKKSPGRPKKTASKSPRKKAAKKSTKNKLGVKNSLVNNINAKKKEGHIKVQKQIFRVKKIV